MDDSYSIWPADYEVDDECPKCDGRCVDKHGNPCRECNGEGFILTLPIARGRMASRP